MMLGMRVGRAAFKKGSIPRAVDMPPHSPHALRPSTFRAPGWGAPVLPSSCGCWRSATPWGLALFRHRPTSRIFIMQPGCSPPPTVTQDDDCRPRGGEKQAGLRPLPRPQLQGCSSSVLGRGHTELGPASAWAGDPLLPLAFEEEGHPPAVRRRRPPAMRGKANCCCLARVQLSVLYPGDGRVARGSATSRSSLRRRLHRGVAQHVVRREGGTRVLGRSRSCSCGEDRSEDLSVRFGATTVRWRGVGGQVAAVVGAEVVAARGGCLRRRDRRRHLRSDLRLFGFDGLSSPLMWGRGRGPFHSSVCPEVIAAAV
jgi:hypothetical protein